MSFKCKNCGFESDKTVGPLNHCIICGDDTVETKVITKEVETPAVRPRRNELDLNKDGKVDSKDTSLAGRILRSSRRKK